ncbi:MAG: LPS export ABC transporter periplasmic protein LptC [Mariniphaga sp.]|nr:LPS export ABC transporter periplasmic protein LptC [Mariniphaga sp.]
MKLQQYVFDRLVGKIQCCKNLNIVVLSLGATMLILSCSTKVASDLPTDLISVKKPPSVEATDFQTFLTDSGVVRYFLKTPKLLIYDQEKEPYKEFPEGFHLQQFDGNKKIISELSANYGKNFEIEDKWLATGNVVLVNNKGDTLRSEELIYLIKEEKIYTDKFVSIKKGNDVIDGSGGFESDTQMTRWTFKKTRGQIYVEDK